MLARLGGPELLGMNGIGWFLEAFFGEPKMHFVELRLGFDTRNNGKHMQKGSEVNIIATDR